MTNDTAFTKPMQPCNADLDKIQFPCLAQKKWDGMKLIIRCQEPDVWEFLGRSMKPIKNQWVVEQMTKVLEPMKGTQGWVYEGELQAGGAFENCDGLLSAHYREFDDLVYHVFDQISDTTLGYHLRYSTVQAAAAVIANPMFKPVLSAVVPNMEALMVLHNMNDANVSLDGTIVRQEKTPYKAGKRTVKEGFVVKIKDMLDDEAEIIGVEELMHNDNEGFTNELGRTERSTAKAGLRGGDTLGKFVCRFKNGKEFKIGSFKGMTRAQGKVLWDKRETLIGKLVKFKYMRLTKYDVPLHPVYLGFRDPIDMD